MMLEDHSGFRDYNLQLAWDPETEQYIASIPALGISDYATDLLQAVQNIQDMAEFHLECLLEEQQAVPEERRLDAGLFVRLRFQSRAA